jgi:hypothetical protein
MPCATSGAVGVRNAAATATARHDPCGRRRLAKPLIMMVESVEKEWSIHLVAHDA